jgi:hypothetical protein
MHIPWLREPMIYNPQKDQKAGGSSTSGHLDDAHILNTGYDDSGQQEEKCDIRCSGEIKKAFWFSQSRSLPGMFQTGFTEMDAGECTRRLLARSAVPAGWFGGPPGLQCHSKIRSYKKVSSFYKQGHSMRKLLGMDVFCSTPFERRHQ